VCVNRFIATPLKASQRCCEAISGAALLVSMSGLALPVKSNVTNISAGAIKIRDEKDVTRASDDAPFMALKLFRSVVILAAHSLESSLQYLNKRREHDRLLFGIKRAAYGKALTSRIALYRRISIN
jgi:hypothetical protein